MMQNKKILKGPTQLRIILVASITTILVAGGGAFYYLQQQLATYTQEVNKNNQLAEATKSDVSRLEKLSYELQKQSVSIVRAKNIVADSRSYQYQNQIVKDIEKYAQQADSLLIKSFAFEAPADSQKGGAAPAVPTTTAPAVPTTTAPSVPAGLKSTATTITFPSGEAASLDYTSIMKFLRSIELNLTKMNITSLTFTSDPKTGKISIDPIEVQVYIK